MSERILVTGKKISSMELVTNVTGNEKIPTGQPDDLAITPNQLADYTIARGSLVNRGDLLQVEGDLGTQIAEEEAARIAADNLKVDKEGSVSSVAGRVGDVVLVPSDVLVEGFGSQEDVNKYVPKPFLSGYAYGLGERVVLNGGEVVKSLVDGNSGNPNVDMTGWVSTVSGSLSDTIQTFNTPEAGVDPVTGVAEGAYFNVRSSSDESYVGEYRNVGGVPTPTGKSHPSGSYVETIAEHTALPFKQGKTYGLHERVKLGNGDIVKSTIDGNTDDPNVNMTGWVKTNSTLQIFNDNGLSQNSINESLLAQLVRGAVTTSSVGIVSTDINDSKHTELNTLIANNDHVIIDTYIALNDTVLINQARKTISCANGGELVASSGMSQKVMLSIKADYVTLDKLKMKNPLMLKSATGGKQTAVSIEANYCTVKYSYFEKMLHSVIIEPNGEWYGTKILYNIANDCIGVGAGVNDDGSQSYGEDRGDAFVCWGSRCIMSGNFAFAMEGQDCRIAFHCEGLGVYAPNKNPVTQDRDFVVTGNFAYGPFRRHFVFEAVLNGFFDSNISNGGATWWPVCVPQAQDCIISNMFIRYDRTTSKAGVAWSPIRGAIAFLNSSNNLKFSNINILMAENCVGDGIVIQDHATGMHTNISFDSCTIIHKNSDSIGNLAINSVPDGNVGDFTFNDCKIINEGTGFKHALFAWGTTDLKFNGGKLDNIGGEAVNISGSGSDFKFTNTEFKESLVYCTSNAPTSNLVFKDCVFKNTIGTTDIYAWRLATLTIKDCTFTRSSGGNIAVVNSGVKYNVFCNENLIYNVNYTIADLQSSSSSVNTFGKFSSKVIALDNGDFYIAAGGRPTSKWFKLGSTDFVIPS